MKKSDEITSLIRLRKCRHCRGTGREWDHRAIGRALAVRRRDARVLLRQMSDEMKLSTTRIGDLEHGRRGWNKERISAYLRAVKRAKGK